MDIEHKKKIIEAVTEFVKQWLSGAESGHDWWHIHRVSVMAKRIAGEEHADVFVVELAALLHDISDPKFNGGDELAGERIAEEILGSLKTDTVVIEHVKNIIHNVSFKGGNERENFSSKELDVVQDADRLDAIGAIGIARAFNYGGFKNREIYNPEVPPVFNMSKEEYRNSKGHTINHFYEKLLLLKSLMKTETGLRIAEKRHLFLQTYLEQFLKEWDGIA